MEQKNNNQQDQTQFNSQQTEQILGSSNGQSQPSTTGAETSPSPQSNKKSRKKAIYIIILLIIAVIFVVAYFYMNTENTEDTTQIEPAITEPVEEEVIEENTKSYEGEIVTSGLNKFSIEIPNGWGEILRPMDSDWLMTPEGTSQPVYAESGTVSITDLESFGSDGQRVFTVLISDNVAEPEGTVSDFAIPNSGNRIEGTKYSITYTDTLEGLGGHKKGEKRYEYRFALSNGSNLVIWYNVFAEDNNDQTQLVDEVVRSIIIN